MADWGSSDSDIHVESVEEILDTNPDLYKQRTIAALNERKYNDAVKEAETAVKYGNNVLEYHVLLARSLFEQGTYRECMKYIKDSGLWEKREDDSLLYDEQDFITSSNYACSLVFADSETLTSFMWNKCSNNKVLILLLEIIMENHEKGTYEIKSEIEFSKAVQQVKAIQKIQCEGKNPRETNFYDEIQKRIVGIVQEINQTKVKGNRNAVVSDMIGKFTATCESVRDTVKVRYGETKEDYVNRMEDSIDLMQSMLGEALQKMADITGYTDIKDSIYAIIDSSLDGKSNKKDLFKMAKKCRELIDEEIEFIKELGDEGSLKDILILQEYTEDENGTNIFEVFAGACVWIGKKVAKKLSRWCKVDDESSVFRAICKKLCDVANKLRTGTKIVLNTAQFVFSIVVAGVLKVIENVHKKAIYDIFARQTNWKIICRECFSKMNVFMDELECQYLSNELDKDTIKLEYVR